MKISIKVVMHLFLFHSICEK